MAIPALYNYAQAAEMMGVTKDALVRKVMRREIGHKKIGKFTKFTEAHITEYLDRCEQPIGVNTKTGTDAPRRIRRSPRLRQS